MRKFLKATLGNAEDALCIRGHYKAANFVYGCYRFVNRFGKFRQFGWRMITLK